MSRTDLPSNDKTNRPTLVLMAGLPGTGKSTLALTVGQILDWPVIDKDTLKSPLLDLGAAEELAGRASYELLFALSRDLLVQQQLSVILDSPAAYPVVVGEAAAMVRAAAARLKVVLCLAPQEVRNRRVATRISRRSQPVGQSTTTGDGHDRFGFLPPETLAVDTTRPLADLVTEILAYLTDYRDEQR